MTQLQRFIQNGEVEITPHPITGVRRLVTLKQGFSWNPVEKTIVVQCFISHLDQDGNPYNKESLPNYNKALVADLSTRVDKNGAVVFKPETPQGIAEWELLKTQYDYIVDIANNQVNIFQIMLSTIMLRAQQGKFDQ